MRDEEIPHFLKFHFKGEDNKMTVNKIIFGTSLAIIFGLLFSSLLGALFGGAVGYAVGTYDK